MRTICGEIGQALELQSSLLYNLYGTIFRGENMKKEFIFLGPPACGKGTQTAKLAQYLNLPHIDTGSLLRFEIAKETQNGKIAKSFIDKGNLVPADLVANIIKNRLAQQDCADGYILDGFPRSVEQAEKLEIIRKELNSLNSSFFAIYFDIDTDILMERIVNRRSCPVCGEIYNLAFKPPEKEGICDKCGSKLTQRKDDTREVAQARFDTYNTETAPLTEYYKQKGILKCVDADGSINEVWERLLKIIRKAD